MRQRKRSGYVGILFYPLDYPWLKTVTEEIKADNEGYVIATSKDTDLGYLSKQARRWYSHPPQH